VKYMLLIYADDAERVEKMDERMPTCAAYAEAKEQLGGFHTIDVPDLDTALAWAARCPSAARGVVEVRPIWPT